jgi:hypothetical protein
VDSNYDSTSESIRLGQFKDSIHHIFMGCIIKASKLFMRRQSIDDTDHFVCRYHLNQADDLFEDAKLPAGFVGLGMDGSPTLFGMRVCHRIMALRLCDGQSV